MPAHGRADAAHEQRAADHAGSGRRRRTEERTATASDGGLLHRRPTRVALLIAALLVAGLARALPPRTARLAAGRSALRYARHRAARLVAAENRLTHRIEKTTRRLRLLRRAAGALVFLDVGIGGF